MSAVRSAGLPINSTMTPPEPKTPEQKFREVAGLYEKQFMREMVKAMRSTVHESGLIKENQAEKIFREQLDDEYVDKWSDRGGVGFADIIYDQLMQKFGPVLAHARMQKPQGPLAIDEKSTTPVQFKVRQDSARRMDLTMKPEKGNWTKAEVISPWSGTVLNKIALADNQQAVEIDHGHGFLGRYVFKGSAADLKPSQQIDQGHVLGKMSPDGGPLYWSLRSEAQETGPGTPTTPAE